SAVAVFLYAFSAQAYSYLAPLAWLQHPILIVIGIILLVASLLWTLLAQIQMGNSWRIGIDEQHATELVQTGVFRFSRNPIFLGMMITLLGFFLVIPNALTLLVFGLGVVLMQIQIRLEEEYLMKKHGERYAAYCRNVRRWL
ncbi:MAG: methyltransferase family protein, partial [bacterium]